MNDCGLAVEVRRTAALALGWLRLDRGFEPLARGLADSSPHVRLACIYAMGELGGERVIDRLLNVMPDLPEGTRRVAWSVLARISHQTGRLISWHAACRASKQPT